MDGYTFIALFIFAVLVYVKLASINKLVSKLVDKMIEKSFWEDTNASLRK